MIRAILLSLAALLACSASFAVGTTANVAWTAPTTYSDEIGRASCRERVSSPV